MGIPSIIQGIHLNQGLLKAPDRRNLLLRTDACKRKRAVSEVKQGVGSARGGGGFGYRGMGLGLYV